MSISSTVYSRATGKTLSPENERALQIFLDSSLTEVHSRYKSAQSSISNAANTVYVAIDSTYKAGESLLHQVVEHVNYVIDKVNHLTQTVIETVQNTAEVLNFSEYALASDNAETIQLAQHEIDHQIRQVQEQLKESAQCSRQNEYVKQEAGDIHHRDASQATNRAQQQLSHNNRELNRALTVLVRQREALTQKLEALAQQDMPEFDDMPDIQIIIMDVVDDALKAETHGTNVRENSPLPQAFTERRESQNLTSQNQETHQNCQTLIAKEQYSQMAKEAQKLPESLKASLCAQLLQAPVKESALAAAKEFLSSLSGQGQIFCSCLIALAEGKTQDMFMLAQSLSERGKTALTGQLLAQGKIAEAEKIVQTMMQGPDKNYALCTVFMAQGKDALVILQAKQTNLPDSYIAMLAAKFIATPGKMGEAMLLAGMIKDPSALQNLCKAFLEAGAAQEVVELAKDLPPEMQLAVAEMLMEAGCMQEAMELGAHMPAEQQTALFQMLMQKNPGLAMQFAAKIAQNPEQAKQLLQMLMDKGCLAEARLLLKLANNPQLDKEFAHLLAQEETKKSIKSSATNCESEESSTDEDEQEESDTSSEEEEEEETEEED
jgi:hypothetical protein